MTIHYVRCDRCGYDTDSIYTWHLRVKHPNLTQYEYDICRDCFARVHSAIHAALDEAAPRADEGALANGIMAIGQGKTGALISWQRLSRLFRSVGYDGTTRREG